MARHAQAALHVEAAVQVRIVDQTFPADRGAWLLEVDAHHDHDAVAELAPQASEAPRVFLGGAHVVDRARADQRQEPRVAPVEDRPHLLATADNGRV